MTPSQCVCTLYLAAVNLKFGLDITSEKSIESLAYFRHLGMRLGNVNIYKIDLF